MEKLPFTGERVVPDSMGSLDRTYLEHMARYNFALKHISGSVLDAACGSGYGTKMLGAEGVDVSEEAVNFAKERYGIKAEVCDLEKDFPPNLWDTVVSFETIEHLEDPNLFLERASKHSKRFIFSIPLNNPSRFHKQVYSLKQAKELIYKYFNTVEWYEQTGTEIKKLQSEKPTFLIGLATNKDQPMVDLVVVSHNSKKDLQVFVPSIIENTVNCNLLVIDNSDQEETKEYVKELKGIFVENKGYGSACNAGARLGKSDFVVFMNSDLKVDKGWLEDLLLPFNEEKVGIVGARLFSRAGIEYPTPEKDMAIGCVFAMRRSVYEELGGFDETFFLFFEETDMCRRAVNAGYKVVRSEAKITHFAPNFLPDIENNPFLKKCWDESKAYFFKKHGVTETQIKKDKKVLIGMPSGSGLVSAYTVDGLFKLQRPCPTSLLIIERQAVDVARNYLIETAIKLQVDYLLFVDDDGVLPADTLVKMLEDDKDIVGAPMMTRSAREDGKHKLCVFEKYDFYIGDGKTVNKYRPIEKLDAASGYLRSVDAIGGACMLVKREVFEALFTKHNGRPFEYVYEVHETKEHGVTLRNLSEDMCFSERAKNEGFEIWVDTRIRPVHLGKPKFVRFEQEGENLPALVEPLKGGVTLSENLK
jgi:GT2 family glycosyltransferase